MAAPNSVDDYLAQVSEPERATLQTLRETIRALVPDAVETISYQMPTFRYHSKALVGFAAFTNHCSLFPYSSGVMSQLKEELAAYDTSGKGGTIRFTAEAPLTASVVEAIVATRIAEIKARARRS